MKILAISDTHNQHSKLEIPKCDILIHAGDATGHGSESETRKFLNWFAKTEAAHKIYVEGNHDFYGERFPNELELMCEERGITLLKDSGTVIDGNVFWGSPVQPWGV